jgi:poly-gamma-glutamate capsule biosynthesis protein CapA/YwtB (metallophosphatase superfamily)/uncharacterized membrane protein (UPF0127 family)
MNKKLIIFTAVGLLCVFAFGFFVYKQSESTILSLQKTDFSAGVSVSVKKPTSITTPVTVLVFGDMMLDRKVREQINKNGLEYPFALIKDFLQGNDVVVANAEGPFTDKESVTLGKKDAPLQFTFDPAILPTLKNLGFTLLGQANNHTLNFDLADFQQSISFIEKAGLSWFGDPRNIEEKPYITAIRGEKIAFIGYNEFAYHGLNNVLQAIKNTKKNASFIVVYAHWGEEYELNATSSQQKIAHAFVDAGADAVIGSHPHVIQPIEMYNSKPIFYSLGNFIFDQALTGPTTRGLAVKISLRPDSATYNLFPISIIRQQASLLTEKERQEELNRLNMGTSTIVVPRDIMPKEQMSDVASATESKFKTIQIGTAIIRAELATTEAEQLQGLSGRPLLAANTGMLFVFQNSADWGIWMKDMNFPIDVLWVTNGLKVSDIVENMLPSSYPNIYTSHVPTKYVLEVPAGTVKEYGITVGQSTILK